MAATVLDGTSLARRREDRIVQRAAAVRRRRGHAPGVFIVAFGDGAGRVPHVERKLRSFAAAGVEAEPLVLPPATATSDAIEQMHGGLRERSFDAVFVQIPFPAEIDGDAFAAAIPEELDVDVMTPARVARFLTGDASLAPVTVSAGLLLLDAYGVAVTGRRGVVVADDTPFARMFAAALAARGASMDPLVAPSDAALVARVNAAGLVVVAAGSPGLVQATDVARGAVAIDVGYFNEGGRGDIDVSGGFEHLAAFAPVPGGIGPMTVSVLIERVVRFAEPA
jgi:methylenetetrahydrofolate dehydrogenase (NADP+) / methenyltetrahydrofolate cyclohydrolase